MASDVKWIKLDVGIFDNEKIKLIESMPNAYAIITCWFKLLCLAGKQNNSGVFMIGKFAYTEQMLATSFRMEEETVKLALEVFQQFGMVEIVDGVITLPNWGKHQTLDKLERNNEYHRKYMEEYRKKQKLITSGSETEMNCDVNCDINSDVNSEVNVNTPEEELEEDIDKDNIYRNIVSYLNERCNTQFRASSKATRKHIHARLEEGFTLDDFKRVIDNKAASWLHDEKMVGFLRPQTLFGTKFESYLNERTKNDGQNGTDKAEPVLYGQWL